MPGKPLFFATAVPLAASRCGVLVESHMGRPIKIEGNPAHPASLGATDAFSQAAILSLYDPDRSQVVMYNGPRRTPGSDSQTLAIEIREQKLADQGARAAPPDGVGHVAHADRPDPAAAQRGSRRRSGMATSR